MTGRPCSCTAITSPVGSWRANSRFRLGGVPEPELARSYGIRSIPALLVFRDGKVVDQIAGAVPFAQLSESVERVLNAN